MVLVGALVAPILGSPPAQAIEGLDTTATTTYSVDFEAGVVRAQLELSFENIVPDRQDAAGVRSTYFRGVELGVHGDATAVAGRSGDQPLAVELTPIDAEIQRLSITFGDDLDYGERRDVVITYDLPGRPPRSAEPWRANEAFAAFLAYAYGDPGASTVRLVVAPGHHVDDPRPPRRGDPAPEVDDLRAPPDHDVRRAVRTRSLRPAVIATQDGSLTETVLDVNGRQVVLQAWPDDPEWAGFVGSQMASGLTELESLIGLPIRDERQLVVRESVRPILEGFAGWYDNRTGVIELGEDLDPGLMFHELSHAWFNDDISPSRWITEGFAETYANLVLERTGGAVRPPVPPVRDGPGALALDEWAHPNGFALDGAVEQYGYAASYFVVDSVVDEVGVDRMGDVLAAVEGDLEAYRGTRSRSRSASTRTGVACSTCSKRSPARRGATELFRTYVASADDLAAIDQRAAARLRYAALVDDGAGWAAPDVVRDAMETWEFDVAGSVIDASSAVLANRAALQAAADQAGIDLPTEFEARYESADDATELVALDADLDALTGAVEAVAAATDAAGQRRTTVELLGLDGEQFGDELAAAREAITVGDPAAADAVAAGIVDELTGAEAAGQRRAAAVTDTALDQWWVAAVAVAGGLLLAGLVTGAGRRRSGRVGAQLDPLGAAVGVELGVGRRVDLDEDALSGAALGSVDGVLHASNGDTGQGSGSAGIVEGTGPLVHVGDAVLELHEHVGAVIDAQAIPGAEVLVDPDAHGGLER